MNGFKQLGTTWVSLQGLVIEDINGKEVILSMATDDEFYLQLAGNSSEGPIGLLVWYGDKPTTNNTVGAETLLKGQQGKLVKGVDDIWVRALGEPVTLIIRKVQ